MDKPTIACIGAGRLGSTLALALGQRGYPVKLCDNDRNVLNQVAPRIDPVLVTDDPVQAARGAEIVLLTLPDDAIKGVSERLAAVQALTKGQVLCHCSGFLSSAMLVANKMLGAATASFHPLASFPVRLSAWEEYLGSWFGIEGDAPALFRIKELAAVLECRTVEIKPGRKALYHAAGVLASNYLAALLIEARDLMEESGAGGLSQELVLDLSGSVLRKIRQAGIDGPVSGPIVRGDIRTVAGHLEAIRASHPKSEAAYRALGLVLAESIRHRQEVRGLDEIIKLLKG